MSGRQQAVSWFPFHPLFIDPGFARSGETAQDGMKWRADTCNAVGRTYSAVAEVGNVPGFQGRTVFVIHDSFLRAWADEVCFDKIHVANGHCEGRGR